MGRICGRCSPPSMPPSICRSVAASRRILPRPSPHYWRPCTLYNPPMVPCPRPGRYSARSPSIYQGLPWFPGKGNGEHDPAGILGGAALHTCQPPAQPLHLSTWRCPPTRVTTTHHCRLQFLHGEHGHRQDGSIRCHAVWPCAPPHSPHHPPCQPCPWSRLPSQDGSRRRFLPHWCPGV
jgi:hypothetical protein